MRLHLVVLFVGLFLPSQFSAQTVLPFPEGIFNELLKYDPLHVVIETDLKQLKSDKEEEQWQPGIFKVLQGDSTTVIRLNVQVAARGNMRKKNCDFPPVKIRFYNNQPDNDSIADINELKLVTSCKDLPQNEDWVKREFLLYELYNLVTEQSFRVKAAKIHFEDPEKKNRNVESFSFFIESVKELSARLEGQPMKPRVGSTRSLDSTSYDRMCVFQYMIGNTDWSVRAKHNIKLIYLTKAQTVIAVPYDFDYSGAVGTEYAVPNGDYPIQTVQDRYYLGLCRSPAHYQQVFDFYLSKEKELLDYCGQAAYLAESSRKQMSKYFQRFFEVLKNPALARREIVQNCNKGR
jgi:hypothetical protein